MSKTLQIYKFYAKVTVTDTDKRYCPVNVIISAQNKQKAKKAFKNWLIEKNFEIFPNTSFIFTTIKELSSKAEIIEYTVYK